MSAARILVADSDRAVSEMLQIRLDVAGYHPLAARSGVGALEIIRNMRPAAFVLDLGIREMDAFDLLTILQKDHSRPLCPILLIGKRLGIEEIKRAATLGVRGCMVKPFSGADMLDRLAKMLKPAPHGAVGGGRPGTAPVVRPTPPSGEFFV
jgi:DNA-binding response OmpR family regulator